jgi:hypothetical protein
MTAKPEQRQSHKISLLDAFEVTLFSEIAAGWNE